MPGTGAEMVHHRRQQNDVHNGTWVSRVQGKLQHVFPPPSMHPSLTSWYLLHISIWPILPENPQLVNQPIL